MDGAVNWDGSDYVDESTSFLNEESYRLYSTSPSYDELLQKFCKNVSVPKEGPRGKPKPLMQLKPYQVQLALKSPKQQFPFPRFSCLSRTDHQQYLMLSEKFRYFTQQMYQTYHHPGEVQFYMDLRQKVLREQDEYNKFLAYIAKNSPEDYQYLSAEVNSYIEQLLSRYEVLASEYPQDYTLHQTLGINVGMSYSTDAMMKHAKTLHVHGQVPFLQIPYYENRKSFVSKLYDKMMSDCPPTDVVHCREQSGLSSRQPVSRDYIAVNLAEKYEVDIVMSVTGLEALIDNHPPHYEHHWQIPVRVTEQKAQQDDGTERVVKTIFIDKPLLSKHHLTNKQKSMLFHELSFPRLFKTKKTRAVETLQNLSKIFLQQAGYKEFSNVGRSHCSEGSGSGGQKLTSSASGDVPGTQDLNIEGRQSLRISVRDQNVTGQQTDSSADVKAELHNTRKSEICESYRRSAESPKDNAAPNKESHSESVEHGHSSLQMKNWTGPDVAETTDNATKEGKDLNADFTKQCHLLFSDSSSQENLAESEMELFIDTDNVKSAESQTEDDSVNADAKKNFEVEPPKRNSGRQREAVDAVMDLKVSDSSDGMSEKVCVPSENLELTDVEEVKGLKTTPVRRSARLRAHKSESDSAPPPKRRAPKRTATVKQNTKESGSLQKNTKDCTGATTTPTRQSKRRKSEGQSDFAKVEGHDDIRVCETKTEASTAGKPEAAGLVVGRKVEQNFSFDDLPSVVSSGKGNKSSTTPLPSKQTKTPDKSHCPTNAADNSEAGCKQPREVLTRKTLEDILKLKGKLDETKSVSQRREPPAPQQQCTDKHPTQQEPGRDDLYSRLLKMGNPAEVDAGLDDDAENSTDNAVYDLWSFGKLRLLVRGKVQGYCKEAEKLKLLSISPKLEYQPKFGLEKTSSGQLSREWMRSHVQPNTILVRGHINAFTSEVMMLEKLEVPKLLSSGKFNPAGSMKMLHSVFEKMKTLPVGEFLLVHSCGDLHVCIYRSVNKDNVKRATFHLGNRPKTPTPHPPEWLPLDTELMLLNQQTHEQIPATFPVYPDTPTVLDTQQHSGGRSKKKKKKKGRGRAKSM